MPTRLLPLLACASLAACQAERAPVPNSSGASVGASPTPTATTEMPARSESAAKPATLELPERFTALGTEPFWAAKVAGDKLTYQTPEDQTGQPIAVSRTAAARSVELRGTLDGKPLRMTVGEGRCSDGMSDSVYPYAVELRLGDEIRHGCARRD